jgi:hypothetical protein
VIVLVVHRRIIMPAGMCAVTSVATMHEDVQEWAS